MMLVQPVAHQHALDLQQAGQDARACSWSDGQVAHLAAFLGCARASVDARFEPIDVLAQRVDAGDELLGFRAARHVAAFFLQILGDVLRERVGGAAREAERRARDIADLVRGDVADDARQLFFQIRPRRFSSSLNACATSASPWMCTAPARSAVSGAGPARRRNDERRAGQASRRRCPRASVCERHALAVRFEVHAQRQCPRRAAPAPCSRGAGTARAPPTTRRCCD